MEGKCTRNIIHFDWASSLDFFVQDKDLDENIGSHPWLDLKDEDGLSLLALADKYIHVSHFGEPGPESSFQAQGPHSLVSLPPCEDDWELWEVPVNVHALNWFQYLYFDSIT